MKAKIRSGKVEKQKTLKNINFSWKQGLNECF